MTSKYILVFCLISMGTTLWAQDYKHPFQNPDLDPEKRIENLLSLMTLDEKVSALSTHPDVPRLGVKGTGHVEGLHGLALGGPAHWGGKNRDPLPTTTFPQAYGLGATWDRDLLEKIAMVEGYEARYSLQKYDRGGLVIRAPNADLARDPRWGRTEESYGEDAFLTGELTKSFVKGLQGSDDKYWQAASLMKHFLANSNEDGRTYTSSDFSERLFREYYSYPFYIGVTEGGSQCYMAAYNKVNGIPAMVHPMLREITQKEWGLNGIICTDGGAYRLLLSDHKYYPDKYIGAAATIKAGINQFLDDHTLGVYGALANGYVTEEDIDEVLKGVYRVMINLGFLDPADDNPYTKIGTGQTEDPWLGKEHQALALKATEKSIVLLKNTGLLPLKKSSIKTLAVIGSVADVVHLDWYSGTPPYAVTPLEGLKNMLGQEVNILFAENNTDGKAVEAAKKADAVIVFAGNDPICQKAGWAKCYRPSDGREAVDRQSLELPEEDLIKLIVRENPKTIVSLVSSFPYAINWSAEHVPAILHVTQNSQELGNALARVIFGEVNPAGRLTQTWVRSIADLPDFMNYDITNGRTYMYFKGDPLFAFGHGLSYTSFDYGQLKTNKDVLAEGQQLKISFDLKNTGDMDGDEVVQLYVKHLTSEIKRPVKELKNFKRIHLKKGESKNITLALDAKLLRFWSKENHRFELEKDQVEIQIGSASDQIKLKKEITIK